MNRKVNIKLVRSGSILFLVLFSFCHLSFSQVGKKLFFPGVSFTANFPSRLPQVSLAGSIPYRDNKPGSLLFIKTDNFRKPFFCRLEDKLCDHFGVWIKFRAGSDEIYRKQVAIPEKQVREKDGQINQL